ncbi:hypothetical protein [uncultured Methanobrevibacter sp.]|nr:hypothetical protein [uncultured Methanobrevibacter sp.]
MKEKDHANQCYYCKHAHGFLKSTVVANIPRIIVSTYKITADKKKAS